MKNKSDQDIITELEAKLDDCKNLVELNNFVMTAFKQFIEAKNNDKR